jgi:hypothetical protein
MNPLSSTRLARREVLLSAALLAVLALAIYMPHIVRGGWYSDDWVHVAAMSEAGGLLDAVGAMSDRTHRPGLALSLSLFHAIAGEGQAGYLVIGAILAAVQAWLFYLVLRVLGLRATVAGAGAAIFVVLPIIDSTRLWMAAFPIQVSGMLYLLGVLVALHGVSSARGRRAVAWHLGAGVLYFAAVLTYELVAGLVALAPLLYAVHAGWRPATRRILPDLASIGLALAILVSRGAENREADLAPVALWDRAVQTAGEAEVVFRWLFPWPEVLAGPIGLLVLLAGMLGAGIAIGRGDDSGRSLAAWAKIAGLASLFTLAGLVMLLPADPYFVPRISGIGNRTGAFAAFGAVLLLIALIVLALAGLGALLRRPRLGFLLAAAMVAVTGLNLAARELRQQEPWADSWQQQQQIVATADTALDGRLPAGAAVISFGHTTYILPADVSVFANNWDFRGALWETYDQPDVTAQPWLEGMACGPNGMVVPDAGSSASGSEPYPYRRLIFFNAATRTADPVRSRAACEAAVGEILGAPVVPSQP